MARMYEVSVTSAVYWRVRVERLMAVTIHVQSDMFSCAS